MKKDIVCNRYAVMWAFIARSGYENSLFAMPDSVAPLLTR